MFVAILSLGVIFAVLLASEFLWRAKILRGEYSRKTIHIIVGAFIAFWPLYMPMQTIVLLAVLLFIGIFLSRYLSIFRSIHGIQRKTWGDLLFPIGIGLVAALEPPAYIFTAAILHLSAADGLAALAGVKFKQARGYIIAGQRKTLIGSIVFLSISLLINTGVLSTAYSLGIVYTLFPFLLGLSIVLTAVEGISMRGTDNITVPLSVAFGLSFITLLIA